jgi:zinc/manganese transport system permease protein
MGITLGYLGIHVLKREVIFIDIALAQIAAVGAITAHLVFEAHGNSTVAYACSVGCVVLAALCYALIRGKVFQISLEAIIGISYAIAAAAALFLVGIEPGGHVHVQQVLSGSLLWVNWHDVIWELLTFLAVGLCFFLFRNPLAEISNSYHQTRIAHLNVVFWDFTFYVLLGLVITLCVQLAGVVVVFAYLIIPATIASIYPLNPTLRLIALWAATVVGSVVGLLFAYCLDFSIGPAISLSLGVVLVITVLLGKSARYSHAALTDGCGPVTGIKPESCATDTRYCAESTGAVVSDDSRTEAEGLQTDHARRDFNK